MPASAVDDLVIFKDVAQDSVEERNGRRYFSAGVNNTVNIEKIVSIVGKLVPSVSNSPKSSKLVTVVVTNRKLTSREWESYDSHSLTVEVTYLKAAMGIATLKTEDTVGSFPGN